MRTTLYLLIACAVLFFQGCSLTGSASDTAGASSHYGSSASGSQVAAGDAFKLHENGITIFPHMPVPVELEKVDSETVVFTTPEFHGGIFTLKGDISPDTAADFFQKRLPQEGWRLAGRLESETCYMAFKNDTGGTVLMQISRVDMGFKTEVRIFVSEGTGSGDATRFQSP